MIDFFDDLFDDFYDEFYFSDEVEESSLWEITFTGNQSCGASLTATEATAELSVTVTLAELTVSRLEIA